MNEDTLQGNWKQFKGKMVEQWGKLTDDDFDVIAGRRDQFLGKIQERHGIAGHQLHAGQRQPPQGFLQRELRGAVGFHQRHGRGAARCGLEPQGAGAGEQVEHSGTGHVGRQPVEQCLAHAVGRGTQAGHLGHGHAPAPEAAADDANLSGWSFH